MRIFDVVNMGLLCPCCGSPVILHSQYIRHPILDGVRRTITIQRVKCTNKACRHRTHSVLPDFLLAYKHYGAAEVEKVLDQADAGVAAEKIDTGADVSTVRRWHREFRERAGNLCIRLRNIAACVLDRPVYALPPEDPGILPQLRHALQLLPEITSCGLILGQVFQWLTMGFAT